MQGCRKGKQNAEKYGERLNDCNQIISPLYDM